MLTFDHRHEAMRTAQEVVDLGHERGGEVVLLVRTKSPPKKEDATVDRPLFGRSTLKQK